MPLFINTASGLIRKRRFIGFESEKIVRKFSRLFLDGEEKTD